MVFFSICIGKLISESTLTNAAQRKWWKISENQKLTNQARSPTKKRLCLLAFKENVYKKIKQVTIQPSTNIFVFTCYFRRLACQNLLTSCSLLELLKLKYIYEKTNYLQYVTSYPANLSGFDSREEKKSCDIPLPCRFKPGYLFWKKYGIFTLHTTKFCKITKIPILTLLLLKL